MQMAAGLEEMGGNAETSSQILAQMEALQGQSDDMVAATAEESSLSEGEAKAAELESSLDELDGMLTTFQGMDTAVLVAPFRSESLSVTNVALEPMHFYVPAVIALLLQHLAITLSGLSIIREKIGGSMELFRAAPVTAFELMFGKTVSYLLLIGVLSAVLTALIILGLRVPQLGTWASYALVILALLLASLGIGFNISITARSDSQAIQLAMLTLLASIFFSGFFLPLYRLSPPVNIVSWLLPSTYGTIMLKDVMLRGQAPSIVLMLMLFAFALALFLLGWIRLKLQMARE